MTTRFWQILTPALAAFILSIAVSAAWATDTQTILYSFQGIHTNKADGASPQGGVIADSAGNLYGTTTYGGACTFNKTKGCGTVYELSPSSSGWTETVLYRFSGGADGANPDGNLVFDANGNLYGAAGLAGNTTCSSGCGVIFELFPNSSGGWTQSVIYTFSGQPDGQGPGGGLIFDAAGNLYGITSQGGSGTGTGCAVGCGTIYELSPASGGGWTESILYDFSSTAGGVGPTGHLVFDAAGNLYGTTGGGGSTTCDPGVGCGTVFRLANVSGTWQYGSLYTFQGPRGATPGNGVVIDGAGNLYGTTLSGGSASDGVVFELSPTAQGQWKETLLHVFTGDSNGFAPQSLTIDTSGNIYGTSNAVAFKLSQSSKGGWIFQVLSSLSTGDTILAPLLRNASGDLFGVSFTLGTQVAGTVYELSPVTAGTEQ